MKTRKTTLLVLALLLLILALDAIVLLRARPCREEEKPAEESGEELAPAARLLVLCPGVYTADLALGGAPRTGRIVIAEEDPAALVEAWRAAGSPALPVELPASGLRAGVATNLLVLGGDLYADARLNRVGAAAFVRGARKLDASLVSGPPGLLRAPDGLSRPALRPVSVDRIKLVERPRFH